MQRKSAVRYLPVFIILACLCVAAAYFGLRYYKEYKATTLSLAHMGGMSITLEVSVADVVKTMAGDNAEDPDFDAAIKLALKNKGDSEKDFVTLFGEAWYEVAPNGHLSGVFATYDLKGRVNPESTNEAVLNVIREEVEAAIATSLNVLRSRVDRLDITSSTIKRIGNTERILVELPGIKEPKRVRALLQKTGNLEFWETYESSDLFSSLTAANQMIKEMNAATTHQTDNSEQQSTEVEFPLFSLLMPSVDGQGNAMQTPVVGRALVRDTAQVNAWLKMPQIRQLFPRELSPAWSIKAERGAGENRFELIALKKNARAGKAPVNGSVIVDAHMSFGSYGEPLVSLAMNQEGGRVWARMTADNVGKSIAIVVDGYVYSYPRVNSEITGGQSQISGNFTIEEAKELASILKSGKLPAPVHIVQEAMVAPQ